MSIRLIVGLGNPGPDYQQTRHNAGAWFTQAIADSHQVTFQVENKFHGLYAKVRNEQSDLYVLQPTTFMNQSGKSVQAVANYFKIAPAEILVAHDELDLPVGTIRLKQDGGHAGHNGLRDIIAQLGSNKFLRLRIGIGHPGVRQQVHNYVLSRPNNADKQQITTAIETAAAVLPLLYTGNIQQAMQLLHT